MNKKQIRLTESDLQQIVKESVSKIMYEVYDNYGEYLKKQEWSEYLRRTVAQYKEVYTNLAKICSYYQGHKGSEKLNEIMNILYKISTELEGVILQCYNSEHTVRAT
jgi:hypothetical protein